LPTSSTTASSKRTPNIRSSGSFGDGSSIAGPHSVVAPNDEERVGPLTLIAGTAPPGSEPTCPNGCPDIRVILVNPQGHIVWQYGQARAGGSGFDQLNTPVCSVMLPRGNVLITDQANERVIEVTRAHQIVWQYGDPNDPSILNGAAFASRLPNEDTLITDSLNNRILEVTPGGTWCSPTRPTPRPGSVPQPNPTRAVELRNGNVLISDQFNHQVIEISRDKEIVFTQGQIGVPGSGFDMLNAPNDAKVVGDYAGLTPPPGEK
jgi:hypothetical protein